MQADQEIERGYLVLDQDEKFLGYVSKLESDRFVIRTDMCLFWLCGDKFALPLSTIVKVEKQIVYVRIPQEVSNAR